MQQYWTISDTVATLNACDWTGALDVLFPWHGFVPTSQALTGAALLKVYTRASAGSAPETMVECYQRGADLVATYAQTLERNVRPQVYWRAVESEGLPARGGLEVILSAQTSLLDSQPQTIVESTLPASEVVCFGSRSQVVKATKDTWQTDGNAPRAVLFRLPGGQASYLEMVHPSDFAGVMVQKSLVRWHLFPEHLEKGVIRRARVRGMLLAREGDEVAVPQLMQAFAQSALALST
jgi:hypothetical protein